MIIKCPNCGKEYYDEDLKYCEVCGWDFQVSNNKNLNINSLNSEIQNSEDHTLATALGFIFAFLFPIFGLVFGVYLVTRKDSKISKVFGVVIIAISIIIILLVIGLLFTYLPMFFQYGNLPLGI